MRTKSLAVGTMLVMAIAVLGAQTAPARSGAQGARGGRAAAPPPTRRAPDVKTAIYYAADALGMLRTAREIDMILTMEFWARGTLTVEGKPCRLASYRASVRYRPSEGPQNPRLPVPAMREDFACAGAGGKPGARQIHVVAGTRAWNEAQPGGHATAASQAATDDRLLRLWTVVPASVVKAAALAGEKARLADEDGRPVLEFPLPPPFETVSMKAVLNPAVFRVDTNPAGEKREFSHLIDRTEVRVGDRLVETTYTNYGDWNEADLQSLVLLPRRIVQKHDGVAVLDLTLTKTDTLNPYVIMPVP
jgi:hypothetical protein